MSHTVYWIYDNLCGWCYGAVPAVRRLAAARPDWRIVPLHVGMFADRGARAMDADFAAYAWRNDQRIQALSGQVFSDTYRTRVLGDRNGRFDSGPSAIALQIVKRDAPDRVLDAIHTLTRARNVDGQDAGDPATLQRLLIELGYSADPLQAWADPAIHTAVAAERQQARTWLARFGADGVPFFVLSDGERAVPLPLSAATALDTVADLAGHAERRLAGGAIIA